MKYARINRKLLTLLIAAALILTMLPATTFAGVSGTWVDDGIVATEFAGGDGTLATPYQIASAAQLAYLAKTVNDGVNYIEKYFIQTADIDLAGHEWVPIGRDYAGSATPDGSAFQGSYDGGNYKIKNMTIASITHSNAAHHTHYAGLFGVVNHSSGFSADSDFDRYIKNIKLVNINVDITLSADKQASIGGLFAEYCGFHSAVENCSVSGNLRFAQGGGYNKSYNIGGLVGNINSTFTTSGFAVFDGCIADVTINVTSGGQHIGGFAGYISESTYVKNCSATGNVTVDTGGTAVGCDPYTGGFFGWGLGQSDAGTITIIENCYATGDVSITTKEAAAFGGGFGGAYQERISIKNCYSTGNVSVDSNGGTNAIGGGFIGGVGGTSFGGTIENCYTLGSVSAQGATGINRAYGFSGNTQLGSTILNCAALGAEMKAGGGTNRQVSPFLNTTAASVTTSGNRWYEGISFNGSMPISNNSGGSAITASDIYTDGTIGSLFDVPVWTITNGKLPGFGKTVNIPVHLIPTGTAILYIKKDGAAWGDHGKSFTLKLTGNETVTASMAGTNGTMTATVRYGRWKVYEGIADTGKAITVDVVNNAATLNYYTAAVASGTGGGNYVQGDTVTLTADAAPAGQRFKEWSISPAVSFVDGTGLKDSTAKFTMPNQAVTATAVYEAPITADFTDPNFLAAVRNTIGKPTGDIYANDVAGITILVVEGNKIQSLAGIQYFKGLKILSCANNQLTTLDVSGLKNLEMLACYSNKLTSLNVSGLNNLTHLSCYSNELTSLDVSGLGSLVDLNCTSNKITTLNMSGLDSLIKLWCHKNEMTVLDVSGLGSLESLNCAYNQLTALNVSGLLSLQGLNCPYNRLTTLDVSGLGSLTYLDCSYNYMPSTSAVTGQSISWDGEIFIFEPQRIHSVTVQNGTGSGNYVQGDTVTITANAAPDGKIFDKWTPSDGLTFANASSESTTFTMPGKNVTVTATYKNAGGEDSAPGPAFRTLTENTTGITVSGNISEGAVLKIEDLALGNSVADDAIRERMKDNDYVFILGRNISLSGSFTGTLTLSLPVGTQYNGETVTILHAKQDGTLETYTVKVIDGKATFDVTSLSPFAVFQKDDLDDIPNTGDVGTSFMWWILLAVSGAGIMTLMLIKKKALRKRGQTSTR